MTSEQAKRLHLKSSRQLSPLLERCCLRVSANVSYRRASEDIELLTGIGVSAKTQHRLVHRQTFNPPELDEPVEEVGIDGGSVRLITPPGTPSVWKQYKAVAVSSPPTRCHAAWLDNNVALLEWLNSQPLATPVTCLGDGHDGIWNLFNHLSTAGERREILDWFHLMENLGKVGGSTEQQHQARTLLWRGKVEATLVLLKGVQGHHAQCFCQYLKKHRHRIPNYDYLQAESICSIGSGAVESCVKQIDRRLKISGARWKMENVPKVLAHRCAYLNRQL